jgi:hypothetical protein
MKEGEIVSQGKYQDVKDHEILSKMIEVYEANKALLQD